MGDALPHQAGADDADLLHVETRHVLRPAHAFLALLEAEEERPQHGTRGRILKHTNELPKLDLARAVHRKPEALVDRLQDRLLRGHVSKGGRMGHRVGAHQGLGKIHRVCATAGHLVSLLVPGLRCAPTFGDPLLRGGDQFLRLHELVDQTLFEGLVRSELLALHDQSERALDADQTRKPLRAAETRHQAEARLRQADLRMPLVDEDSPMAGKGDFVAAAERHAVERRHNGLATGLHPPKLIQHGAGALQELFRIDRPGAHRFDLLEIAASHEHALLARRENDALHRVIGHGFFDARTELGERVATEHVHRAALVVPSEDRNAVFYSIIDNRHCLKLAR